MSQAIRIAIALASLIAVSNAHAETFERVSTAKAIRTLRLDESATVYRCVPVQLQERVTVSYSLVNKPRRAKSAVDSTATRVARSN